MVGTSNESDPEMAIDLFGGVLRERSIETHGALKIFKTPPLWFPISERIESYQHL